MATKKGLLQAQQQARKGYFEVADGGTIFLDEVGELPLTTQVRLLRVLENGEFLKVGSSEVQKTNVRIVAATNLNMQDAIAKEKFQRRLVLSIEYHRNSVASTYVIETKTSIYCFENLLQILRRNTECQHSLR